MQLFSLINTFALLSVSKAWVADVYVKPATMVRESTRLTPDELRDMYRLDKVNSMLRVNAGITQQLPYTATDRAQLFQLDTISKKQTTLQDHETLTPADFVQLWKLKSQLDLHQTSVQDTKELSTTDLSDMWHLYPNIQFRQTGVNDHKAMSSGDYADMWNPTTTTNKGQRSTRSNLLTDEDRVQLWHLDDNDKAQQVLHDEARRQKYTEQELKELWHLDESAEALSDDTKHQVYTDNDREQLWHLSQQKTSGPSTDGENHFTAEELAELWHLDDPSDVDRHRDVDASSYTAEDRRALWHL